MISPIRPFDGVLLDIDHTLALDHKVELRVLHDMYDELAPGKPGDSAVFMEQAARDMELFRQGKLSIEDAMTGVFRRVPTDGIDPHQLATAWMDRCVARVPELLEPAPGAVQLLADLQAAYPRVGILTNGWGALQQKKAEVLGFKGPIFVSDQIGVWKPEARAFHVACQGIGSAPTRTAYIGDTPKSDIVGADGAGLTTVWVNELHQPYPEGLVHPDYEVQEVAEVRSLLLPYPSQQY